MSSLIFESIMSMVVANGEEIDIVTLPAGVYIVSVSSLVGGQYQEKLVISE